MLILVNTQCLLNIDIWLFHRLRVRNWPSEKAPKLELTMLLTSSPSLNPPFIILATLPPLEALMLLKLRPWTLWPIRYENYLFRPKIQRKEKHVNNQLPAPVRCLPPLPNKACDCMSLCLQTPRPPITKETGKNHTALRLMTLTYTALTGWRDFMKWSKLRPYS